MMSAMILFIANNENCVHIFIHWLQNREVTDH